MGSASAGGPGLFIGSRRPNAVQESLQLVHGVLAGHVDRAAVAAARPRARAHSASSSSEKCESTSRRAPARAAVLAGLPRREVAAQPARAPAAGASPRSAAASVSRANSVSASLGAQSALKVSRAVALAQLDRVRGQEVRHGAEGDLERAERERVVRLVLRERERPLDVLRAHPGARADLPEGRRRRRPGRSAAGGRASRCRGARRPARAAGAARRSAPTRTARGRGCGRRAGARRRPRRPPSTRGGGAACRTRRSRSRAARRCRPPRRGSRCTPLPRPATPVTSPAP